MEKSLFSRLPGEIRNHIYGWVLTPSRPIKLCVKDGKVTSLRTTRSLLRKSERDSPISFIEPYAQGDGSAQVVRLSSVCRAFRAEVLRYYFSLSKLIIHADPVFPAYHRGIGQWLKFFGDETLLQRPKSVEVFFGEGDPRELPGWNQIDQFLKTFDPDVKVDVKIRVLAEDEVFSQQDFAITFDGPMTTFRNLNGWRAHERMDSPSSQDESPLDSVAQPDREILETYIEGLSKIGRLASRY